MIAQLPFQLIYHNATLATRFDYLFQGCLLTYLGGLELILSPATFFVMLLPLLRNIKL